MKVDPKIDPNKVTALKKKHGEVKYCCKCHKVLGEMPVTSTYYYYEGEGFYCGSCNNAWKERY